MKIEIKECPFCKSTEFVTGYSNGQGGVWGHRPSVTSQTIYYTICRDCGSIVRSYIVDPEKLLDRKDRR